MFIYSLLQKSIQNIDDENVLFFRTLNNLKVHLESSQIQLDMEAMMGPFSENIPITGLVIFEDTSIRLKIYNL
jgi:hypothetical protein